MKIKVECHFDIDGHPKILDIQEFCKRLDFPCSRCGKNINFGTDKFLIAKRNSGISGGVYHAKCAIEKLSAMVKYHKDHPRKEETYVSGAGTKVSYMTGSGPRVTENVENYFKEVVKQVGNDPDLIPELL